MAVSVDRGDVPNRFGIIDISPNPALGLSVVNFELGRPGSISLRLFNSFGQEVHRIADGYYQAGGYRIDFDAAKLSQGMYFVRLETNFGIDTEKIVVID